MRDLSNHVRILLPQIRSLIASARRAASRAVDTLQVATNFEIGRLIVKHEQGGEERAECGKALVKELSAALTEEFGRGFSKSNLEYMRRFYLVYQPRVQIAQTVSGQLPHALTPQTVSGQSAASEIQQTAESRAPRDIDVVTFFHLPAGQTQSSLLAQNRPLFVPQETKARYRVDAYFVQLDGGAPEPLVSCATYWYSMWSHRRSGDWKGYLRIDLSPTNDQAARANLLSPQGQGGQP